MPKKITNNVISVNKQCAICGNTFDVFINETTGEILTDCFHGYLNKYLFLGWTYGLDLTSEDLKIKKVHFKNTFYKIVGFCKSTRTIYYNTWKLFHRGKIEYWKCPTCNNRPDNS